MNDNDIPGAVVPERIVFDPDFGDPHQMLNMRDWLTRAVEHSGARFTGGGCGMGAADIDVEVEGHMFNITIKPIMKGPTP